MIMNMCVNDEWIEIDDTIDRLMSDVYIFVFTYYICLLLL